MTALLVRANGLGAAGAVLAGAVVIGVASTYDPRYCLLGLAGIALVAITMSNLIFGVVALTLFAFFERLPGLSGVPLSKPFGVVLVVSWVGALARGGAKAPLLTRDRPLLAGLMIALVGWGVSSVSWASDPVAALTSSVRLAMVVVLLFIVYSAVQTRRDLLLVTWAFLVGAFMISLASLLSGTTVEGRLSGGVLDPNYLAAALASSIVVAGFLLPSVRLSARIVLLGFIVTYSIALVLTQSRGGLVATATALGFACVIAGPVRVQTIGIVVVIASIGLIYFAVLAPATLRERVTDVSAQGSASRTDTWQIALNITADHPLLGVGLGNFPSVESRYIPGTVDLLSAKEVLNNRLVVHNTYLELLSEIGSVGVALFVAVIAATLVTGWRGIVRLGAGVSAENLAARGIFAGTLGLLVAYVFLSGEYQKQLWLLLGLVAAIPNVARATDRP